VKLNELAKAVSTELSTSLLSLFTGSIVGSDQSPSRRREFPDRTSNTQQ
jgi:hypothetical protein